METYFLPMVVFELSAEKYCSASILMGRAGVEVTHDYEIVEID